MNSLESGGFVFFNHLNIQCPPSSFQILYLSACPLQAQVKKHRQEQRPASRGHSRRLNCNNHRL